MKVWLGLALVSSPFIVMTVMMIRDGGVRMALEVWGIVALACAAIGGGIALLASA